MYCTITDLQTPTGKLTLDELKKLSTNQGETIDLYSDRINAIISSKSNYIDAHLRNRYTLPLVDVPILKSVCIELVTYELLFNRQGERVQEKYLLMYKNAMNTLEDIKNGKLIIKENLTPVVRSMVSARASEFDLKGY